jgi:hypothetical protein
MHSTCIDAFSRAKPCGRARSPQPYRICLAQRLSVRLDTLNEGLGGRVEADTGVPASSRINVRDRSPARARTLKSRLTSGGPNIVCRLLVHMTTSAFMGSQSAGPFPVPRPPPTAACPVAIASMPQIALFVLPFKGDSTADTFPRNWNQRFRFEEGGSLCLRSSVTMPCTKRSWEPNLPRLSLVRRECLLIGKFRPCQRLIAHT